MTTTREGLPEREIRICLKEDDFAALVRGKTVTITNGEDIIRICLVDIGYDCMRNNIDKAEFG